MSAATKKMLVVIVKEGDVWHGRPLYPAVVQHLRQAGIAGTTVLAGTMGFGRHHRIHHEGLFGIADDRPITIFAVDDEARLRSAVRDARDMLQGAMTLLLDAEIL
jgi:PII-like signaling protein